MSAYTPEAFTIRAATAKDEGGILQLLTRSGRRGESHIFTLDRCSFPLEQAVHAKVLDGCLLVAERQGKLGGMAGIDLDRRVLSELVVIAAPQQSAVADKLLERAQRLALAFGVLDLGVAGRSGTVPWFLARAYRPERTLAGKAPLYDGTASPLLVRSLRRLQSRYARGVAKIGEELGIGGNYGQSHRLQLQNEARKLDSIGLDVFGREQWMTPRAASAWQDMRAAALEHGVELQAVSAWRSVDYQRGLVQRKLAKGQTIEAILEVSAAPGYSEHHTGRAIDVTTPGCTALSEEFAHCPAFKWLQRKALRFGFHLSFPRGNRHRLAFEPWHWCFGN